VEVDFHGSFTQVQFAGDCFVSQAAHCEQRYFAFACGQMRVRLGCQINLLDLVQHDAPPTHTTPAEILLRRRARSSVMADTNRRFKQHLENADENRCFKQHLENASEFSSPPPPM
jgi:hypothetical protein